MLRMNSMYTWHVSRLNGYKPPRKQLNPIVFHPSILSTNIKYQKHDRLNPKFLDLINQNYQQPYDPLRVLQEFAQEY